MPKDVKAVGPRRRSSRFFLWFVLVLAFLAVSTVYGFNRTFPRNGEAALGFVPEDAGVVTVVDLQPSMGQYMAFRKIAQSLTDHGFASKVDDGLKMLYDQLPQAKELKPYILPSLALVVMPPNGGMVSGDPNTFVFLSINNPGKVSEVISRGNLDPSSGMTKMYLQKGASVYAGVIDRYLLLSTEAGAGPLVDSVRAGSRKSLAGSATFNEMRSHIDGDANFMMFVTKNGAEEFKGMTMPGPGGSQDATSFAMGWAVRDKGLSITSYSSTGTSPSMRPLASMHPIRSDLFNHLPTGAYGLFVISDSAKYYEAFKSTVSMGREEDDQFFKETGMHLDDAFKMALSGDAIVALYPQAGSIQGCNLLVVLDNANGANPAAVQDKLRGRLGDMFKDDPDGKPVLAESEYGGAKVVRISGKTSDEFRKSIEMDPNPNFNFDQLLDDKTIMFATVDNCVIFSTSEELLHRAIDAEQGRGSLLSSDAELAASGATLGSEQFFTAGSLSRLGEGVDAFVRWDTLEKSSPPQAKCLHGLVDLLKQFNQPIVSSTTYTSNGMFGRAFIPMDYDHTISALVEEMNALKLLTSEPRNDVVDVKA